MSLGTHSFETSSRRSSIYVRPPIITKNNNHENPLLSTVPSNISTACTESDIEVPPLNNPTTILHEIKFLFTNSAPLICTFLMQFSLSLSSLFVIGNLCVDPVTGSSAKYLSSASLAVMTFSITGLAVIEGLSTSLDTFCSQAFGAQKYTKVGLYTQRCTLMILTALFPIVCSWWVSARWLSVFIPQEDLLEDIQDFLRIMSLGIPALTMFETGKRFVQTQGHYNVSTYSLISIFPINLVLIYWMTLKIGYLGAPIAIAISYWLMFFSLVGYCVFIKKDTLRCWAPILPDEVTQEKNWFTRLGKTVQVLLCGTTDMTTESDNLVANSYGSIAASQSKEYGRVQRHALPIFQHWKPMMELAWPGLVMIESEYLSFEILTIFSTYLGNETEIAIQTVLASVGTLIYQDVFAMGCVISTRSQSQFQAHAHNQEEEKLAKQNAIKCIKACYILGLTTGVINCSILIICAKPLARLFTKDQVVIETAALIMPVIALNQLPNSCHVTNASILRGQGRQRICGILNLVAYYCLSLPLSHFFTFSLGWGIKGLWIGCSFGLSFLAVSEMWYVVTTDWNYVLDSFIERLHAEHQ
ncbi:hypothetical protein ACO0QE_003554 [Hanseniaspora vineae]